MIKNFATPIPNLGFSTKVFIIKSKVLEEEYHKQRLMLANFYGSEVQHGAINGKHKNKSGTYSSHKSEEC